MKALYRNLFFLLGLAAIIIMLFTFDMDYTTLWEQVRRARYWFFAVLGTWVVIYFFNALSWYQIIRQDNGHAGVGFWRIYKLTISGFALNYATPFGLMGGEPYRIMELAPQIGTARATSSVLLYVMMHIFSHVCFWLASILLFCLCHPVSFEMAWVLTIGGAVCLLIAYFFLRGYRNGMVVKTFKILSHIPLVSKWAASFYERNRERLQTIDSQIAELHSRRRSAFIRSFVFEFIARVLTSAEIFFILKILTPEVNFLDCVIIMAFTSFFANLFFFLPMQLGAREGGFALSVSAASLSGAFGVYTALITRLRELIWISIGVALMKVGNRKSGRPRGLIFDYGGTLDQPGRHWFNVLWEAASELGLRLSKEQYREAYVYGERTLAKQRIILPDDNFYDLLLKKVQLQFDYLVQNSILPARDYAEDIRRVADRCYQAILDQMSQTRAILQELSKRYPLVLVSNFYGNIHAVLDDLGLSQYFNDIIESAVVGVRKPDPQIFRLGVEALGMQPGEVCVVGDSFSKDIQPAQAIGCQTIWIEGETFKPEQVDRALPTHIVHDLTQLRELL